MDAPTLGMLILVTIALAWVGYYAIGVWQVNHAVCICGHIKGRHASALDYDSDYGDPQHVDPHYIKPGTCRDCWGRCRVFIAVPAGN